MNNNLAYEKSQWINKLGIFKKMISENLLPTNFSTQVDKLRTEIDAFKFKVALVGKFSTGKSTLINQWLGSNLQSVDLGACTSVAIEFHYSEKNNEKMVVHRIEKQNPSNILVDIRPVSAYKEFSSLDKAELENILYVELHINNASLARYPEVVLVDTPGFGSNFGYHEKALQQYVGEGISCILCVTRISQVGVDEMNFIERQRSLGQVFSILVCQEALNNKSQREAFRKQIADQAGIDNAQVSGCSALEGELDGFEYLLNQFEEQRNAIFSAYFSLKVKSLIDYANILTKQLLMVFGDAEEVHTEKQKLASAIQKLEQNSKTEEERLLRDCQSMIASQIVSDVSSYLQSRREAYVQMVINKQSISATVRSDSVSAAKLAACRA